MLSLDSSCPELSGRMWNIKVTWIKLKMKWIKLIKKSFIACCYACVILGSILLWNSPPPILSADAGLQDLCFHWSVSRSFLLFFCILGEPSCLGGQRSFIETMTHSQQFYSNAFYQFKIFFWQRHIETFVFIQSKRLKCIFFLNVV